MQIQVEQACNESILPFRAWHRTEMNCQIVHDSIHRREGWTRSYLLILEGTAVGFGSIAIAGPWKDKPTIFEFYVLPQYRGEVFALFEAFLAVSNATYFEVQSNDMLLTVMLHAYGRDIVSEKIVFAAGITTALQASGVFLRATTSEEQVREAIEQRQGGCEWILEIEGDKVATGGIMFHYNRPFGDIYMEVTEPFRKRGIGSYFVQELKRICYELGAVPCARCNPANVASRRTLQRAGFVPFAHILDATIDLISQ
jgi:GNAT superfamily N-acetyltransferase